MLWTPPFVSRTSVTGGSVQKGRLSRATISATNVFRFTGTFHWQDAFVLAIVAGINNENDNDSAR
jgi:hypothetical protein